MNEVLGSKEKLQSRSNLKPIRCTLWDGSVSKEVEDFSVVWGVVEDEETGERVVKFNLKFEDREFALWISDRVSLMTMQKMLEDVLAGSQVQPEEIVDDVNAVLSELRQRGVQGWQFESAVGSLCEKWQLSPEQTKKIIALSVAIAKLVEECLATRSAIPYIL